MPSTAITRRYHFEAAHFLPKVAEGHRCKRMHGHNYELEVTVGGKEIDETGFVLDFWDLDKIIQPIIEAVDHRTLNDIPGLDNPTAENIAAWFFVNAQRKLPIAAGRVLSIRVYETKDCWADVF